MSELRVESLSSRVLDHLIQRLAGDHATTSPWLLGPRHHMTAKFLMMIEDLMFSILFLFISKWLSHTIPGIIFLYISEPTIMTDDK